jgi:hypothetical protein
VRAAGGTGGPALPSGHGRRGDEPGDGPLDQEFLVAHHDGDRYAAGGGSACRDPGSHA